jgi:hypothetical protein
MRGDEVRPFSEGKTGRRRGNSTMPEVNNTMKSGMTAGWPKAAASVLRSKMTRENWVGWPNVRLGPTGDSADEKIIVEIMRWAKKIEEGKLVGQNKKKKEIKIGKNFLAAEN